MNIPKLVAGVESIAEWLTDRMTCFTCYNIGYVSGVGGKGQRQSGVHVGRAGSRIMCCQEAGHV